MLGDLIALKHFEKKDWKMALTYAGLTVIGTSIVSAILGILNIPVVSVLLGIAASLLIRYYVLKDVIKYPKSRIKKVIALGFGIDAIITIIIIVLFGAILATLFGALLVSVPREALVGLV